MGQKFFQVFLSLGVCLLLAACSSGPEMPEIVCTPGTCTLAPKKATSRPYEINGVWYHPQPHYEYDETGMASFYGGGDIFHGRPTATGEIFDMNGLTAAHKTLPLPCIAEVTNLENGRQIKIKVNDRGPFPPGRMLDVSRRVAQLLGFEHKGLVKVRVRTLVGESLALNNIDPSKAILLASAPSSQHAPISKKEIRMAKKKLPRLPAELFDVEEKPLALVEEEESSPTVKLESPQAPGIFVDLGTHKTFGEAKKLSHKLDQITECPIQPVKSNNSDLYSVRVGPLASMYSANQVLDQLIEAGHPTSRIIIHR